MNKNEERFGLYGGVVNTTVSLYNMKAKLSMFLVISKEKFIDHTHLNLAGNRTKAELVIPYIMEIIRKEHKK